MTGLLRSLVRVRFVWFPAVVVGFAVALFGAGPLPVGSGLRVVAAGFLVAFVALATGFFRHLRN